MPQYKPEAEGELYTRRTSVPLTKETLRQFAEEIAMDRTAGYVEVAEQTALSVLREHFNAGVILSEKLGVVVNGVRVCAGFDSNELVKDAFDLIDCARRLRKVRNAIESDPDTKVPSLIGHLITYSMQLGMGHERLLLRFHGYESIVAGRKKSNRNTIKGGKPKYTDQELQQYIDKAKKRYPSAKKTALIDAARRISQELCPDNKGVAKSTFWDRQEKLNF